MISPATLDAHYRRDMALRIPPGRAGRTWLVGRLEIARRGAELLDRKRQALLREQARRPRRGRDARRAWREAAAHAALWSARAAMLDGAGRLELLARHVEGQATLAAVVVEPDGRPAPGRRPDQRPRPPAALGARRQLGHGDRRPACREATHAAARYAVAQRADAELSAELARAARRLRALQTAVDPPARAGARPARPGARREPARASRARALAHPSPRSGKHLSAAAEHQRARDRAPGRERYRCRGRWPGSEAR